MISYLYNTFQTHLCFLGKPHINWIRLFLCMVKSKHGLDAFILRTNSGNLFCTQFKGKSEFVAWNVDYFNLSVIEKISSETRLMIQWRSLAKGRVYWLDLTSQIVDSDPSQCKWSNDKLHYASSNFLIDVHTVYHKKFKELLDAWNWAKLPSNCIIRIWILRHSFAKRH